MSELRTARDLTVPGHAEEARAALHRAMDFGTLEDRAAWAARWGESAVQVAALHDPDDRGASDELRVLTGDIEQAESRIDDALAHLRVVERALSGERTEKELADAEDKLAAAIEELEAISL